MTHQLVEIVRTVRGGYDLFVYDADAYGKRVAETPRYLGEFPTARAAEEFAGAWLKAFNTGGTSL